MISRFQTFVFGNDNFVTILSPMQDNGEAHTWMSLARLSLNLMMKEESWKIQLVARNEIKVICVIHISH